MGVDGDGRILVGRAKRASIVPTRGWLVRGCMAWVDGDGLMGACVRGRTCVCSSKHARAARMPLLSHSLSVCLSLRIESGPPLN